MAPVGTLYTVVKPYIHPRSRLVRTQSHFLSNPSALTHLPPKSKFPTLTAVSQIKKQALAVAAINNQELTIPLDFEFGKTNKTPSYLAKFPLGKIPAFESSSSLSSSSSSSSPFFLTESNAIALHLADTSPDPEKRAQLLGSMPQQRALVQQWLWFSSLHLEPALTTLCVWRFGTGQFASYDAKAEEKAAGDLARWLGYLEGCLKGSDDDATGGGAEKGEGEGEGKGRWLAGTEAPSIADLAVCGHLHSGFMLYVDREMRRGYPLVVEYYGRLLREVPEIGWLYGIEGGWVEVRKEPDLETGV